MDEVKGGRWKSKFYITPANRWETQWWWWEWKNNMGNAHTKMKIWMSITNISRQHNKLCQLSWRVNRGKRLDRYEFAIVSLTSVMYLWVISEARLWRRLFLSMRNVLRLVKNTHTPVYNWRKKTMDDCVSAVDSQQTGQWD